MKRFVAPGALAGVLAGLHLGGGREATSALAGIAVDGRGAMLGCAYAIAWLSFVLAAVPLVVTSLVATLTRR